MTIAAIDGTIVSAELRRSAMKVRIYKSIVFRLASGETKTLEKPIVHSELAPYLEPGTTGRFYTFTSIDHRGVFGVRANGQSRMHFPKNNEVIGMWLALIGSAFIALMIAVTGDASLLLVISVVLGFFLWLYNASNRRKAEQYFASDNSGA